MTWLISLFLGRIFAYLRKLAKKTDTVLDDRTVAILEKHVSDAVKSIYSPKDAAMNFMAAELQMLIDHAKSNKDDNKIWAFLSSIQTAIGSLDFEKK